MPRGAIKRVVGGLVVAGFVTISSSVTSAQPPANRTSSVPAAVLKAFQQAYPTATISASTQERDGDRPVFRVESVDKGRRRVVLYDSSSTVIEVAEQVTEKELPQPVAVSIRSHRRAIYVSGMKVTRGGSVLYHLTVRGSRRTAMIAKPDGTVLSFK